MEALLPSEIARLVLGKDKAVKSCVNYCGGNVNNPQGYLEEQKCTEAAKVFLETCPHLQECRTVVSSGRRFNTRVNGLTLLDVIEKFFAASAMVQERLSKVVNCEQKRLCSDLLEQIKCLVEETCSQRFRVNINVSSQNNQPQNGSPIIASSIRKRHRNSNEKQRCKRANLTNVQTSQQFAEFVPNQTEATSLESLPGNARSHAENECNANQVIPQNQSTPETYKNSSNDALANGNDKAATSFANFNEPKSYQSENVHANILEKCTMGTSTEELFSLCNTEVQTNPHEMPESETEMVDDPIENLSLLTKELLNRTELQERIAENINKAILPADTSMKNESFCESPGNELNSSLMTNLNVKSIVKATESDPAFETFLDEIFGQPPETDTSPDEDTEAKNCPELEDALTEEQRDMVLDDANLVESKANAKDGEIPLKQRLRSSSRQQSGRIEDDLERQKEQSSLERHNAAAILGIINANVAANSEDRKEAKDNEEQENQQPIELIDLTKETEIVENSKNNDAEDETKKAKRAKTSRTKVQLIKPEPLTEKEVMAVPTFIVCPKEEINKFLYRTTQHPTQNSRPVPSTSHFIPIAPKDSNTVHKNAKNVYIRMVKVPQKPGAATSTESCENASENTTLRLNEQKRATPSPSNVLLSAVENVQVSKVSVTESITLYSGENGAGTLLDSANLPAFSVEDNLSLSGTGLSPYLKFNNGKTNQSNSLSDIDLTPLLETAKDLVQNNLAEENKQSEAKVDVIAKRTPRSLMKSRAKNNRLSLSTPRRRSSHVRALDFSTPPKSNSSHKGSSNESVRFSPRSARHGSSICRTSLFKSPPFSASADVSCRVNSPLRLGRSCKVPIATRSPAPKLFGGWDKYNGVGLIIGDTSPQKPNSRDQKETKEAEKPTQKRALPKESWDADLRRSIQIALDQHSPPKKKVNVKGKRKNLSRKGTGVKSKLKGSKTSTKSAEQSVERTDSQPSESHTPLPRSMPMTSTPENVEVKNAGKPVEKEVVKKYAQLKTVSSNLKKSSVKEDVEKAESVKASVDVVHQRLPNMMDLETPRKENNLGVPPTPRLISPNSSVITPFVKLGEDSGKPLQGFVSTPEFPPTPCIAFTPKQVEENTVGEKMKEESCSSYYRASAEPKDPSEKLNQRPKNILARSTRPKSPPLPAKFEITQFEVIKENLPRDQAAKELKISSSESREFSETPKELEKYSLDSENESTDSNTSTSSDSSSSSSSSSTSSSSESDETDAATRFSIEKKPRKTPHKNIDDISSGDSSLKPWNSSREPIDDSKAPQAKENHEKTEKLETSPKKVFALTKSEQQLNETEVETPAKDENLLAEMGISETPSSSKAGVENLTNLSSKISAMITSEKEMKEQDRGKPKIVELQVFGSEPPLLRLSENNGEPAEQNPILGKRPLVEEKPRVEEKPLGEKKVLVERKLFVELEEKRRRMISKFKTTFNVSATRGKAKSSKIATVKHAKTAQSGAASSADKLDDKHHLISSKKYEEKEAGEPQTIVERENRGKTAQEIKTKEFPRENNSNSRADDSRGVAAKNETENASKINENEAKATEKSKTALAGAANELSQENNEEKSSVARNYGNRGDSKAILKHKVEQVKRDLFSDEENDSKNLMTKNRAIDKSAKVKNDQPKQEVSRKDASEDPSDLSHVLECLELVPANRNEQIEGEKNESRLASTNSVEYHVVYDETNAAKKRRRRYNSREPDLSVNVKLLNENSEEYTKKFTASNCDELFSIPPKQGRKPVKKTITASSSSLKGQSIKPKRNPSALKHLHDKNDETQQTEDKSDDEVEDNAPTKHQKKKVMELAQDSKQNERKCGASDCEEPSVLVKLKGADLETFLATIHGD